MSSTKSQNSTGLSVGRVFSILEYLAEHGQPMTLTEISLKLGLPKSSSLKLLSGMTALGYLDEDTVSKSYFPSLKVCVLASEIEELLIGHNFRQTMLEELHTTTGETIGLATQNGLTAQFHNCLVGKQQLSFNLVEGVCYPIHISAGGRALMSALNDNDLDRLIRRIAEDDNLDDDEFDAGKLRQDIVKIRKLGYAQTAPRANQTIKSIARLLPLPNNLRPVAVLIGGPKARIKNAIPELAEVLDKILNKYY